MKFRPIVIVPARLNSGRLPRKALASIRGEPMIVHVWRQAIAARVGPVVVATDTAAIAAAIERAGGLVLMTSADHHSGSDRVREAVGIVDPNGAHDVVINLQGDLPAFDPSILQLSFETLSDPAVAIGTLAAVISRDQERTNSNVVKLVGTEIAPGHHRALYFTRATAPWGEGELLRHIGIYAYRRQALERFATLPPSSLERRERLEQLRALEAGMRIDAIVVDGDAPLSVDTPEDLEQLERQGVRA